MFSGRIAGFFITAPVDQGRNGKNIAVALGMKAAFEVDMVL